MDCLVEKGEVDSLWECECSECVSLQKDWEDSEEIPQGSGGECR